MHPVPVAAAGSTRSAVDDKLRVICFAVIRYA
jgi:hypothetical protein